MAFFNLPYNIMHSKIFGNLVHPLKVKYIQTTKMFWVENYNCNFAYSKLILSYDIV